MSAAVIFACLILWIPPEVVEGFNRNSEYYSNRETFVYLLKSERHEGISALIPVSEGGYLLAGSYRSVNRGNIFSYIIRFSSHGAVLWDHEVEERDIMTYTSVAETGDGGFIIAGNAVDDPLKYSVITRLDSMGNEIWTREYAFGRIEEILSADSLFIVTGETGDFSFRGTDAIAAIDIEGDVTWSVPVGVVGIDFCTSIKGSKSGDVFLGGMYTPNEGARLEGTGFVTRMNPEGDTIWRTSTGANIYGRCLVAVSQEENVVAAGGIDSRDILVFTGFNPEGDVVWTTSVICSEYSLFLKDLLLLPDGRFVAVGSNENMEDGMLGYLMVLLFDAEGHPLQGLTIKTPGYCFTTAEIVCPSPNGGFLIAAKASGYDPERFDVLLLRFDSKMLLPGSFLDMRDFTFEQVSTRTWLMSQPERFP